ncbi:hypothetical protein [Rugamonas apoptosis]|uniref:Uncharacterized protein n=1 Tax=Rugamonas apoptosis TaxID=2758570 RepID=A0A7W2FDJ4_9BURK|nr:hypothetical protein [Rugamonas apoptosis]MBA5689758.1 hypothetical protein [Rugamonas apoptosis]
MRVRCGSGLTKYYLIHSAQLAGSASAHRHAGGASSSGAVTGERERHAKRGIDEHNGMMALIEKRWHRMIRIAVSRDPARVPETSAVLWRGLAEHLTAIIGERGFDALYARSLHQVSATYPWLAGIDPAEEHVTFSQLQHRLQQQSMPAAGEASSALLCTFIDTLTLLIGELVTSSILRAAWGDDTVNPAVSESQA